jgi:hypothetical protein
MTAEHRNFREASGRDRIAVAAAVALAGLLLIATGGTSAGSLTGHQGEETASAGSPEGSRDAPGPPSDRGARGPESADDQPDAGLAPFLGTWLFTEQVQNLPDQEPYMVERYLLLKWLRGKLRVKTVDYLPTLGARSMESDWKGNIRVDRWNTTQQTFTPMPDGTISVGLSGSNGVGPTAYRTYWWAAGRLRLEEDEEGEILRFVTTRGYAPSSKGNAWRPFDRVYRLVSREIDPRFDASRRR